MKYALVTGASRGLGRAIALKVASMNIPVIINYQNNEEAAQQTLDDIVKNGGSAELMRFNVAVKDEVQAALNAWEAAHPDDYITYLVNNAGVRRDNVLFMMPDKDWHDVVDTTLTGFYNVTQSVIVKMMMLK